MFPGQSKPASDTGVLDDEQILDIIDSSRWGRNPGSALHGTGECKPCLFFHTRIGCMAGADCDFCHLAHSDPEVKVMLVNKCGLDVTDTLDVPGTSSPSATSGATGPPSSCSSSVASGPSLDGIHKRCPQKVWL